MSDDNLFPPMPLNVAAMAGVCQDTSNGWLWYCDEHDTHGNADSEDEARYYADAHFEYHEALADDECEMIVWHRTSNMDDQT